MFNFLPYIVFILTFSCVFIIANRYFAFKAQKRFIQERFIPETKQEGENHFWLKPIFSQLASVNSFIGSKSLRERIEQQLLAAGAPLTVNEYFVFKELMLLFVPLILGLLIGWKTIFANSALTLVVGLSVVLGFMLPTFWLKTKVNKRRSEILRALPHIIDLLILAVGAGIDFMIAVRKVVERSQPGPMVDELSRLCQEVRVGVVRREALKNMSKRLNIPEVYSFTRTLIQAERMGIPMGEALRNLSEEIRLRQFQRGEQQALKAPIKMLVPLLFCILPVVLILVAGPILLPFLQSGIKFFQ